MFLIINSQIGMILKSTKVVLYNTSDVYINGVLTNMVVNQPIVAGLITLESLGRSYVRNFFTKKYSN